MIIDCARCTARAIACGNCAVTAFTDAGTGTGTDAGTGTGTGTGAPELDAADVRALTVLANAGMIPPLRYAPRPATGRRGRRAAESRYVPPVAKAS